MSQIARGTVTAIASKGKGASVQLDRDAWYGCGFNVTADKLTFQKGDKISFSFTENGQWKNMDVKTVEVEKGAAPAASTPGAAPAASGTNWDVKNRQDAERQAAISVQSCRNSAIEVAKMLKDLDALPVGTKKTDIAGNLIKFVDDLTDQYFKDTQAIAHGKPRDEVVQSEEFE